MEKYCKKCLLPYDYVNIEFDEHGVCQHCRNYKPIEYHPKSELLEKLKEPLSKNTSKKYDCVVAFSGGRDSTYLLWYIVKELHLRPLCVFSDDRFIPEIAITNMKTTCNTLGVELRMVKHDYIKKCLPHHLKAWMKRPVPESLMFLNVGERIGYETLPEEACIKEGIHLIFSGRTPMQASETYKTALMKIGHKGGRFSWILGYIKQVILNPALVTNLFCLKVQFREFRIVAWRKKMLKRYDITRVLPYYNYLEWNEKVIENILFNELHWKIPEGTHHSGRFGCEIDALRSYLFLRTLGYNDANVDLSGMIRDGEMTRTEAMSKLDENQYIPDDYIKYIVSKAGIDAEKFMAILDEKYPRDYR